MPRKISLESRILIRAPLESIIFNDIQWGAGFQGEPKKSGGHSIVASNNLNLLEKMALGLGHHSRNGFKRCLAIAIKKS